MARVALASTPNGTLWGERGDASVVLLVGATAQIFQHGTTTPVPVYTTEVGSTTLTQPLTVNSSGQLPGWCDAPQKVDIVYSNHGVSAPAAETDLIPGEVAYDPAGVAATEAGRALAAEALLIPLAQKGAAGGVATLDGSGRHPLSETPSSVVADSSSDSASPVAAASAPRNRALRDTLSVLDYGTYISSDMTATVNTARADAIARGKTLAFPNVGVYNIKAPIQVQPAERWKGDKWSTGAAGKGTVLNFALTAPGSCIVPATPTAFTDGVILEDFWIAGDGVNCQVGLDLLSCRYWKCTRLYINGMTSYQLRLMGQRNGLGGRDATYPGDTTQNSFRDMALIGNATGAGAYIGGNMLTATTISAGIDAVVTTIPITECANVLGSTGTIIFNDTGEQVTFSGKSASSGPGNLTGCVRGVNQLSGAPAAAAHLINAGFVAKGAMGQSNTNLFEAITGHGGNPNAAVIWMDAGAANGFVRVDLGGAANNPTGGDGMRVSSYGNEFTAFNAEGNGGYGLHFDQSYECHDNVAMIWDAGGNKTGGWLDENGSNTIHVSAGGIKVPNQWFGSGNVGPYMLHAKKDGLLRWVDGGGTAHQLGYISRPELAATRRGILAETYPQALGITLGTPTATATPNGTIYSGLVGLRAGDVVTNVVVNVGTAGVGTAPTTIKLALVSKAGVVLATTANLAADARWTSIGAKVCALTVPYTITADDGYYLAFLQSGTWGTTQMQLWQINNTGGSLNIIASNFRAYALSTLQTDISGSVALNAAGANTAFWLAAS